METIKNGVTLVSLFGHWLLHREVNGRHFFGHDDSRIGLSILEEPYPADARTRPFQETRTFVHHGEEESYLDEPYSAGLIESFGNLTLEDLERWVARGT